MDKERKMDEKELLKNINRMIKYMNQCYSKEGIQVFLGNEKLINTNINSKEFHDSFSIDMETRRIIQVKPITNLDRVRESKSNEGVYEVLVDEIDHFYSEGTKLTKEYTTILNISPDCFELSAKEAKKLFIDGLLSIHIDKLHQYRQTAKKVASTMNELEGLVRLTISDEDGSVLRPVFDI